MDRLRYLCRFTRSGDLPGLLRVLDQEGYFRYVESDAVDHVRRAIVESGDVFLDETKRVVFLDGEDLFERGLIPTVEILKPDLERRGVVTQIVKDEIDAAGNYTVQTSDARFNLWKAARPNQSQSWFDATLHTVSFLNELLARSSQERLYVEYSGNDSMGVFLTERMYAILRDASAILPFEGT